MRCCCCQRIADDEIGVIGRFGKFHGIAQPGFKCLLWPIDTIMTMISMRAQELEVLTETQTMDGFVVKVAVTVQYQPIKEKVNDEFFELMDPAEQISTYVNDIIRGILPRLYLDQAVDSMEDISTKLKHQLEKRMENFGYAIPKGRATCITEESWANSPSPATMKDATADGWRTWKDAASAAGRAPTAGAGVDDVKILKGGTADGKMLKTYEA